MVTDRDISAIASWHRHDPGDDPNAGQGRGRWYFCTACRWRGGQLGAFDHWRDTQHRITLGNGQTVEFDMRSYERND